MDLDVIKEKLKTYCAYQERCSFDVSEKLYRLNVPAKYHSAIIDYLQEFDFLNNERFLDAYIRGKVFLKLWGPQKIIYTLRQKGFSAQEIEDVLRRTIDPEVFYANALKLARQKLGNQALTRENKGKIYRFLYNKGYNSHLIYDIINEL